MAHTRIQVARRKEQDPPELLISFLRYALSDVKALSERSGRHLEMAIRTLAEDTRVIQTTGVTENMHRS
jgi:hypothetical protein